MAFRSRGERTYACEKDLATVGHTEIPGGRAWKVWYSGFGRYCRASSSYDYVEGESTSPLRCDLHELLKSNLHYNPVPFSPRPSPSSPVSMPFPLWTPTCAKLHPSL